MNNELNLNTAEIEPLGNLNFMNSTNSNVTLSEKVAITNSRIDQVTGLSSMVMSG